RYLLDANVVSERTRPVPSPAVMDFLAKEPDLWLSVILFHELSFGFERINDPSRQAKLRAFADDLKSYFENRILPVDVKTAEVAGRLRAQAASNGRVLAPLDSLMAATAMVH